MRPVRTRLCPNYVEQRCAELGVPVPTETERQKHRRGCVRDLDGPRFDSNGELITDDHSFDSNGELITDDHSFDPFMDDEEPF